MNLLLDFEVLDIVRERHRAVLDLLSCIQYLLRLNIHRIHLNGANERLVAAQNKLEEALDEFEQVVELLKDMERYLFG